ncbi:uncharacterized protein LOC141812346 [Curcuma longa]|uniref:uncharacterized protein LOC141812346 n=1 Tax=Curcuma longa TaxID=136217 RepID=UPI003D9F0BC8
MGYFDFEDDCGTRMYRDLKRSYWWNDMKRDVADFVARYLVCQQVKAEHQRPVGLLQEIPMAPFEALYGRPFDLRCCGRRLASDSYWVCRVSSRMRSLYELSDDVCQRLMVDRKSNADQRRRPLEFSVGDHVVTSVTHERGEEVRTERKVGSTLYWSI